jgi:hypothetical protein
MFQQLSGQNLLYPIIGDPGRYVGERDSDNAQDGSGYGGEGGRRSPSSGGTWGGAGGGGAGGWPKEAERSASNSSRSHSGSAQIRSANAVSASYVARSMPITLLGTCGSITRSMTSTLFI